MRLVALEAGIGIVLSVLACIGVLYAIGNEGTGPIIQGAVIFFGAMGIGLVAWIVLLAVARRITATRGPGGRVLASFLAAVVAVMVNALLLTIVLVAIGGPQVEFLIFVVPASFAFGIGALIANLLTHLWLGRATPRAVAATP